MDAVTIENKLIYLVLKIKITIPTLNNKKQSQMFIGIATYPTFWGPVVVNFVVTNVSMYENLLFIYIWTTVGQQNHE